MRFCDFLDPELPVEKTLRTWRAPRLVIETKKVAFWAKATQFASSSQHRPLQYVHCTSLLSLCTSESYLITPLDRLKASEAKEKATDEPPPPQLPPLFPLLASFPPPLDSILPFLPH